MTVRGIEAIKLYLPPTKAKIDTNIKEEKGRVAEQDSEEASAMTSVERYRQEWAHLLQDLNESPERCRDLAFNAELKVSKFRSVYWALLLRVLSADYSSWRVQREQQRKRYEKLRQDFVKNPHDLEAADDDPLSQSTKSVWNQYFSDQELFGVIRQDVVRTFPGVDFFRKAIIQNAMANILFYYAREHPYMCYRQGMHEILAPILFVIYGDHQALLHFMEIAKTQVDETLIDVLNPDYLEADSYSIFSRLMSSIESYYRVTNLVQTQSGYTPIHTDHSHAVSTEVEVIGQLNSIRDKILAKEDLHLHNYLLKLEIPLHIFGIRWLRLLFGREFPLLDLLVLWDAIFADSDRFDLPNFILVAMLIRIRDKLLLSDYTTCLTYLMRYPANVDINLILRHALHMQMPKKFDRPPNAFIYFTMHPTEVGSGALDTISSSSSTSASSSVAQKSSNLPSMPSSTVRKQPLPAVAPKSLQAELQQQQQQEHQLRARSTSLGSNAAKVERQIELLQARNAAQSAAMERLKVGPDNDRIVMDGYAENSPELMRLELKNAQTVITIARNKLQNYLTTVRKHVATTKHHNHNNNSGANSADELSQALDGIEELCSFLDVKFMFPVHARRTAPIDQALEANEMKQTKRMQLPLRRATLANPKVSPPPLLAARKAAASAAVAAFDFQSDYHSETVIDEKSPTPSANLSSTSNSTTYEKPDDNGFLFNSTRMLGNMREIELIQIASDEKIVEPNGTDEGGSKRQANGLPIVDPLGQHEE